MHTVQVYDLARSTSQPLSKQKIVGKAGLTRVAFSTQHPIILVGDDRRVWPLLPDLALLHDPGALPCWWLMRCCCVLCCRGCISCLKLSPNLRKVAFSADERKKGDVDVARLDAIIEVALKSDIL